MKDLSDTELDLIEVLEGDFRLCFRCCDVRIWCAVAVLEYLLRHTVVFRVGICLLVACIGLGRSGGILRLLRLVLCTLRRLDLLDLDHDVLFLLTLEEGRRCIGHLRTGLVETPASHILEGTLLGMELGKDGLSGLRHEALEERRTDIERLGEVVHNGL